MLLEDGEILPTINVSVFAVKESWSNRVSLDYLNDGILFPPLDKL